MEPFPQVFSGFTGKLRVYRETQGLQGNSESCQTSKMMLFAKVVKNEKPFTTFVKTSILDVLQGFEYTSELASKVTDV